MLSFTNFDERLNYTGRYCRILCGLLHWFISLTKYHQFIRKIPLELNQCNFHDLTWVCEIWKLKRFIFLSWTTKMFLHFSFCNISQRKITFTIESESERGSMKEMLFIISINHDVRDARDVKWIFTLFTRLMSSFFSHSSQNILYIKGNQHNFVQEVFFSLYGNTKKFYRTWNFHLFAYLYVSSN